MSMFNKVTKTFQWGPHLVRMETGEIARQSSGAVLVDIEGTVVLATVVAKTDAKAGQDFFPLTVDYIEKTYAAGKIPGSFFKREGRPSELETLTSRLIDRPIRPLFPEGFFNEVQVVIHVLSLNPEVQADIAAMIGTSAALAISVIPITGPIAAARQGYVNGEYVLNPGKTQLLDSKMDLVVAGTEAAVLMVESEAQQLTEEVMLGAVVFGHEQSKVAIAAINELVRDAGKPAWDWVAAPKDEPFIAKVGALAEGCLLVGGQRGTLMRSADAGSTWERVPLQSKSSVTAIAVREAQVTVVGLDGLQLRSRDGGKSFARMAQMMGGGDMARLKNLGGGKLASPDSNAAGGQGLSGLPGLPGLGTGGDAKPNPLSGLGLPGFNPFKK